VLNGLLALSEWLAQAGHTALKYLVLSVSRRQLDEYEGFLVATD
jgi:hypothetical protein